MQQAGGRHCLIGNPAGGSELEHVRLDGHDGLRCHFSSMCSWLQCRDGIGCLAGPGEETAAEDGVHDGQGSVEEVRVQA